MNAPPLPSWRIVLASASPRRRQLLEGLDLPLRTVPLDVDESPPEGLAPQDVAEHLAVRKAMAYTAPLAADEVLVAADTTVLLEDPGGSGAALLLNKPVDAADARRMLSLLSGRTHRVVTGVCLRTAGRTVHFSDVAHVTFRALDEAEIAYYVERHRPLDKAGAYGVQDWIGYTAVARIEGSFYTVMGLPMHRLYLALRDLSPPRP